MRKQLRTLLHLVNEDGSSENPTSISQIYDLSDKDLREEMWRIFKEVKEAIEWTKETSSKNQEALSVIVPCKF